jgi:2'-5' RNA ligase
LDVPAFLTYLLREKQEGGSKYEFSSVQVSFPPSVAKQILAISKKVDEADLDTYGRELDPHVTVRCGLHDVAPDKVQKVVQSFRGPLRVKLGRMEFFPCARDGGYDVLKIGIDSPDLVKLNALLSQLPHTDTHPEYHPHATIAYLKQGAAANYLNHNDLEGTTVTFDEVEFSSSTRKKTMLSLGSDAGDEPDRAEAQVV